MKYLGKETSVEIRTKSVRPIEYVRCDRCGKKIEVTPGDYNRKNNEYVHIHTWHNDWGNDSVDSHAFYDLCKECTKEFMNEYIDNINGTQQLELEHKYVSWDDKYENFISNIYDEEYDLVENDEKETINEQKTTNNSSG